MLRDVGEITDVEVVIIPPFTAIAKVTEALGNAQNIKVGAQNMYWEKNGPFTGEISAAMLRDLFMRYVVLGHSERRTFLGETDEIVNRKVRAAHAATLTSIVCIGETLNSGRGQPLRRSSKYNSAAVSPDLTPAELPKPSLPTSRCGRSAPVATPTPSKRKAHAITRKMIAK